MPRNPAWTSEPPDILYESHSWTLDYATRLWSSLAEPRGLASAWPRFSPPRERCPSSWGATLLTMRHHNVPDMDSTPLTPEFLASQDVVLIATDHSAYDYDFIVQHSSLVLDTRNATKNVTVGREKIFKA